MSEITSRFEGMTHFIEHSQSFRKSTDHVLIFDDLERCSLPLLDVMGYINQLVENDNLKVIIVANEEEILKNNIDSYKIDSKDEDYSLIKEKLIGKSFSIEVNVDAAIEKFLNSIESNYAKAVLFDNLISIKSLFILAKYNNLRHLRQAFLDFERFVIFLPDNSFHKKELFKCIIQIFFCVVI